MFSRGKMMSGTRLLFILVITLVAFYLRSPSFKQFCKRIADKSSLLAEQRTVESERVGELQGGTTARAPSIRSGGEARREITGRVTRVSDGDTVWVSDSLGKHKVRLNRIDAPESDQPFGKESAAHLKSLIGGKTVRVEYSSTDQYGRILGIIFLGETDINLQMVKDGCAWHYSHFDKTPSYAAAEIDARRAKRGLWRDQSPIPPFMFRRAKDRFRPHNNLKITQKSKG